MKSNDFMFMPTVHEHQGYDLKFDNVSMSNEDDSDDGRVSFYSRGKRKLFHVSSSRFLLEETITSRTRMSKDGPVSFLQCTSLPFNRSKLNGAFLVFRHKNDNVWRFGFVVKFSYDKTDYDVPDILC